MYLLTNLCADELLAIANEYLESRKWAVGKAQVVCSTALNEVKRAPTIH